MRSARDAGYAFDVFVQRSPIRKSWSLRHVPAKYLRYLADIPGGSSSYDRVIYADADCFFQRDPSTLATDNEERFAEDLELFKAPHPCVRDFISLLSPETIAKHQNDHIINSGFYSVTGRSHEVLREAVLDLARPGFENPHDQTLFNKVLWENPPFAWSTFPEGVVAYGPLGAKKYPQAAVVHYIGERHDTLDGRIRRTYPDMIDRWVMAARAEDVARRTQAVEARMA